MKSQKLPPIHPGKILQDHFFEPRNLTIKKVTQDINIPIYQLEDLIKQKGRIDTDLTCRLSHYFQVGVEVFLNIQQIYDWEYWKDNLQYYTTGLMIFLEEISLVKFSLFHLSFPNYHYQQYN